MSDSDTDNSTLKILLAEDNPDDVVLLKELLSENECARILNAVPNGDELLACLRKLGPYENEPDPDIVLLDINMPMTNGLEALIEIKKDSQLDSIPVVIFSSSNRNEDVAQAYSDGAATYIVKPVTYEELKATIDRFVDYWTTASLVDRQD